MVGVLRRARARASPPSRSSIFIIAAYGLGCIGYYVCGRLMERIGRRPTAIIYFAGGIVFSIVLFQVGEQDASASSR